MELFSILHFQSDQVSYITAVHWLALVVMHRTFIPRRRSKLNRCTQKGVQLSYFRLHFCACRNVHISFSASWFVSELSVKQINDRRGHTFLESGLRGPLGREPSQATAAAEVTVAWAASSHLPTDGTVIGAAVPKARGLRCCKRWEWGMGREGLCPSSNFFKILGLENSVLWSILTPCS